ncbi:NUDIX hydrolase [Luteimonas aquatica]|uniref:NUDIX hydrolase n=1 Tax=Luteimonas aquatica TaxID=450364 RepID=UPI001F5A6930|nr:NUDIX hydrolase [Luteimonas aquatica]
MRIQPRSRLALLACALSLLAAPAAPAFAQAAAPAAAQPAARPLDNYTVQRLIVSNGRGEVLLERNANGWMTPAIRANRRQSVREALDALAAGMGLRIDAVRLAGLFTYKFQETPPDPAHAAVSFRAHYTARVAGGALAQPKEDGREYRWIAEDEAAKKIGIEPLRTETAQILRHPDTLWGGSFLLVFDDAAAATPSKVDVLEAPYPLRGD